MTEISRPWGGTVTGDAGPYSDDQWTDLWKTFGGPVIASQGVFRDQLNEFAISGFPATPINIASGRALVNGIWYESDATETPSIPTPAANPRVDRLVLRADWVLQTVRLTRIAGAEAAAPVAPAITQNDGVTWDLPLWQVFVTVGGVISVWRDERSFIGQYVPTGVTPERVYLDTDWFIGGAPANSERVGDFNTILVGGATIGVINEAGFGSGGIHFSHDGVGNGDSCDLSSDFVKPDLIDAHLLVGSKQPNSDGSIDRTIGFMSAAATLTPVNGVFFRADGGGNWFAVCRAGGVETAVDTGQALDDTWRKFEIRQTSDDVVVFLIDDVMVATIDTNIPTDIALSLVHGMFDDGAGAPAAAQYMHIDYTRMTGDR